MQKLTFKYFFSIFFSFLALMPFAAFAQEINDVAENVVDSTEGLPGLISAFAYLFGLILAVTGILKLKEHVENPSQAPLRVGVVRLIAGGALFALPIVYEAMEVSINGGNDTDFDLDNPLANMVSGMLGELAQTGLTMNFNNILANIIDSISDVPGVISAFAYLAGLYLGAIAIIKLKDHVEDPNQTPIKEGLIRLFIGGAFFALPTVFDALYTTINGDGLGFNGNTTAVIGGTSFIYSSETGSTECLSLTGVLGGVGGVAVGALESLTGESIMGSPTLGNVMCNVITASGSAPAFLAAMSYLFGLVIGFWGLLKLRESVLNPQQVQLWEGISRLFVAGMFFSLPYLIEVLRSTFVPGNLQAIGGIATNTGFNTGGGGDDSFSLGDLFSDFFGFGDESCAPAGLIEQTIDGFLGIGGDGPGAAGGLDVSLTCFINDIFGPMHVLLNFFAFVAGVILIMMGISRMMKSTQEGAKGPIGMGTLMTFVAGSALLSYNALIRGVSTSFFGSPITFTYAHINYLDDNSVDIMLSKNIHSIVSATLQFMILVGLIAFVRGLFVLRGAAEGNQQASVMAGMTHIIGGSLAVNLGPLLNAVQASLGIAEYGIEFGAGGGGLGGLFGGLFG